MLIPQLGQEGPEQTHESAHTQGRPAYTQTQMKGSASVRRKRTPEGNLGIKEGMKSER